MLQVIALDRMHRQPGLRALGPWERTGAPQRLPQCRLSAGAGVVRQRRMVPPPLGEIAIPDTLRRHRRLATAAALPLVWMFRAARRRTGLME
jgi:hypothetical protein